MSFLIGLLILGWAAPLLPAPPPPNPTPSPSAPAPSSNPLGVTPVPLPPSALDGTPVVLDTSGIKKVDIVDIEITENDVQPPVDWDAVREKVLAEVEPIVAGVKQEARDVEAKLGHEGLLAAVNKNTIRFNLAGVGRGELNQVDGKLFVRVVHESTRLSLIFLDRGEVKVDSAHLGQIVARQHIDSGDPDARGKKFGRDVVLVWQENGKTQSTVYETRHLPGSGPWWRDYWRATYKTPKTGDVVLGCLCAAMQMAAAACVSSTKVMLNPGTAFDTTPVILSGIFATVLGTFGATYRNWTYRGSATAKVMKMSVVSLLFAYSLTMVRDGVATVFRFMDPQNWMLHGHIASNTIMNNVGRSAWQRLPEIREEMRHSSGKLTLKLFGWEWNTGISRATFENQMIYLIPFTLKLVGLVGLGVGLTVPFTDWRIDSGTLMLLGSIPLAQYLVMKYAERHNLPMAGEIRKQWETLKWLPFTFPKTIYVILKDTWLDFRHEWLPLAKETVKTLGGMAASVCGAVFRKLGVFGGPAGPAPR